MAAMLQAHDPAPFASMPASESCFEVIVTEVSFFKVAAEARFPERIAFFDTKGFDVFDLAALTGRQRDGRLRQGDLIVVRRGSPLLPDSAWA